MLRAREAGNQPPGTEACPVQASIFGDREELIAEAWNRIRSDSSCVPAIYGLREAGGGSVLFVSDVEFEKLGFKPVPTAPDGEQQASRVGVGQAPAAPCGDEASALQDRIFLAKALTGR